ncbi:glycosyltransferase [Flavisolibacter ginsenosidimutans]|uniref:glycosyltransferase n=1 Tax=Flavisolibacter ginsenosidimutans TaxID=661481 RepID=UPI00155B2284|nr:glycosyltransferase [Flavisolibacter ginsenosidimutans]
MNATLSTVIITPLYKDWESFQILLQNLEKELSGQWASTGLVVVDDFSLEPVPDFLKESNAQVEVLELIRNMGHQKAIAIGLAHAVASYPDAQNFVVMDSDGEDQPKDVARLLGEMHRKKKGFCFARRMKRTEGPVFRILYKLYKQLFGFLTGQRISFGNFCCMDAVTAQRLVHVSEIWLHFSSAVIKSKIPYTTLPTHRGSRYRGKSKMNYTSLINHGLSAIAVYSEFVAVRITLLSVIMSAIAGIGILSIVAIKQFTQLAIPGWTSFVVLGLANLIAQFFSLGLLLSFVILSAKTIRNIDPSQAYKNYIFTRRQLARNER